MKLSRRTFQQLKWKLTFANGGIIALSGFCITVLLIAIAFIIFNFIVPPQTLLLYFLQPQAKQAAPFFAHNGQADPQVVSAWLNQPNASVNYDFAYLTVVDKQGRVIASTGHKAISTGVLLQTRLSAQAAANLRQVLTGKTDVPGQVSQTADGTMIAVAPIGGQGNTLYGALVVDTGPDLARRENITYYAFYFIPELLIGAAFYAFFGFIVGIISGFFTARSFTRRFKKLTQAADNWSRGDFSSFVDDASGDEIGQLAQQLNRMAEQLQNLLHTRQKLATLEERNRLARDLHDSVKQQVFAVSMQVSVARALLDSDVQVAKEHMGEAERLVRQAQKELTSLIRELRPVALEGKGLTLALQDQVANWQNQTGISVNLQVEGEQTLPLLVEEALFRVTQEALANVARHSQATSVQVLLSSERDAVTLTISDNGQGFALDATDGKGLGLLSMRERMQTLGGNVEIQSIIGKGTTITAHCERAAVSV